MSSSVVNAHSWNSNSVSPQAYYLAQLIYREFDELYRVHDQSAYARLLPLNIRILEELDQLIKANKKLHLDLDLFNTEKNDLLFQLEQAKKLNDFLQRRVNSIEDELISRRKENESKVEKMDSIIRNHEILAKNSKEHASRLEEHNAQLQTEVCSAHERYVALLRAHLDGRGKPQLGSNILDASDELKMHSKVMSNGRLLQEEDSDEVVVGFNSEYSSAISDTLDSNGNPAALLAVSETGKLADKVASFVDLLDEACEYESVLEPSTAERDYDDEVSESDIVSENHFDMMKEFEKMANENAELYATKNALNVVKTDLIQKLDDLTGEKLMLLNELECQHVNRGKTQTELDITLRLLNECRGDLDRLQAKLAVYEESELPPEMMHPLNISDQSIPLEQSVAEPVASDKNLNSEPTSAIFQSENMCFTEKEMARVVIERNYYKQSLLELQDTIHLIEGMRARRNQPGGGDRSRSGALHFAENILLNVSRQFSNLFSGADLAFSPLLPTELESNPAHSNAPASENNPSESRDGNANAVLKGMFGHLLGHAAAHCAEAVFGTGNDYAIEVTTQTLADSIPRMLDRCDDQSTCISQIPSNDPQTVSDNSS